MADGTNVEELVWVKARVNGQQVTRPVSPRTSLALFLREELGATSVHLGCEHGVCGACTVVYDGVTARSCLLLAAQADGAEIETLEGASTSGRLADLAAEFVARAALQCGFCTPGMLLTSAELIDRKAAADRATIRNTLSGNICRCTGYQSIVDAVEAVASRSKAGGNRNGIKSEQS